MMDKLFQLSEMKRLSMMMDNEARQTGPGYYLVTSPMAGEGKSLFSAGLAVQQAGQNSGRYLVMDCNWRAPKLHEIFRKKRNFDFQDIRESENPLNFIQKTDYPGLEILTAPRNENCDRFRDSLEVCQKVLDQAVKDYDQIIVDTCSLFPANRFMLDPFRLAGEAVGTMMILMAGVTPRETAKKAVSMFREYELRLCGVLMNNYKNPMQSRLAA